MRSASTIARLSILVAVALSGCAATINQKLDFDPTEPLRVAVLPFYEEDDGKIVNSEEVLFQTAELKKSGKKEEDPHSTLVRKIAHKVLAKSSFDVIPSGVVTSYLVHNGYTKDLTYDYEKVAKTSPNELCALLQCDALLYGKILDWSQSYYGIESVSTIELELKLVRAVDGKVLFTSKVEDSDSRGLTKGPTGYTSLVLEPIKGLSEDVIVTLAEGAVDKALEPLTKVQTPKETEKPTPSIFASTHNAPSGNISRNQPFLVLATGSPGSIASFSIGDRVRNVPMVEVDRMHYVGEYYPLSSDSFQSLPVKVSFGDRYGRAMEQVVSLGPITLP